MKRGTSVPGYYKALDLATDMMTGWFDVVSDVVVEVDGAVDLRATFVADLVYCQL
jgi:hypothetical protein